MSTLSLTLSSLNLCTLHVTARAPPLRLLSAFLTIPPPKQATLSLPSKSLPRNAPSPTCQPGWKPGIRTRRSSLPTYRSTLLLCSPTKPSSVAVAFASHLAVGFAITTVLAQAPQPIAQSAGTYLNALPSPP